MGVLLEKLIFTSLCKTSSIGNQSARHKLHLRWLSALMSKQGAAVGSLTQHTHTHTISSGLLMFLTTKTILHIFLFLYKDCDVQAVNSTYNSDASTPLSAWPCRLAVSTPWGAGEKCEPDLRLHNAPFYDFKLSPD